LGVTLPFSDRQVSSMTGTMSTALSPSATSLRVALVRDEASFGELAESWNELAGDIPFRGWDWAACWWQHYRDSSSELFVLAVTDELDRLVGIAPWYLHCSTHQGRVVRFLGSGEVCSDYLTLLCRGGTEAAVAQTIGDWLLTDAAPRWDLLDLNGVEAADPTIERLAARLATSGAIVDCQENHNCWCLELPGGWDELLAQISSSRRNRIRSLLRRGIDSGRMTVHEVETPDDLERGFEILIELHQKRRLSLSQLGCFASARFTAFHRQIAARLLELGQLRLLWTELEGRPFTVEYGFVAGQTVFYYQTGFETELADESPGWVALAVSLKRAIEEGYSQFDFLRGDEPYKASWNAKPRPLAQLRIFGPRAAARVRYATWFGTEKFKGWARRLLSRGKG
jgi:CelD/BcsL family acetyltransferase involved in cellulose biosynthesis